MKLGDSITLVPIAHGRASFADHVRGLCLSSRFDCVAVDLPASFQDQLTSAIDDLPCISAVYTAGPGEPVYYVPTDPCDAAIEGLRQARQNHVAAELIGWPWLAKPRPLPPLPDEHAVKGIGFDAYAALCLSAVGNPDDSSLDREAQYCAFRLHDLRSRHARILALVHLRHAARVVHHFRREATHNLSFPPSASPDLSTRFVNPDHLYFALGELPFAVGRRERARLDPFAPEAEPVAVIKDLFVATRDEYYDAREPAVELSPARLQVALTFARNLTLMGGRLLPSLFDIVAAAKGVGGNAYAMRILRSAKYYPYLPAESAGDCLKVGVDRVRTPGDDAAREAVNLLKDTEVAWVKLPIKPDATLRKKRHYRFQWNPIGMCSHVPEDRRIESFNVHVRSKAKRVLSEDMAQTEKFLTSIRDGLDIRETLRNWFTGDLYVKVLPPARGELDTVVIIFDHDHDERYPHCATWYAEHDEESTLTFYATDPMGDLIGPGIARASYGGLSLLFPPRPVPNVFQITDAGRFRGLAQQLTFGALLFAKERNVAYVADVKPDVGVRALAARMHKHLVWIPLSSFSAETIRRLRRFHVLNGKHVRSWAARFTGD